MHGSHHAAAADWDRETDLLVAGAGPAGMTAALVAAIEGLDVVVCEKSGQVGGTGATSAGTLWIPGNRQSAAAGLEDSAEDAARYLDALIPDRAAAPLREAYLRDGPGVIDYLVRNSELRFAPCGRHPDYRNNQPGAAVAGRAIVPEIFDARVLGPELDRIRPPIDEFMLLGGMMISKEDIGPLVGRYRSPANFAHAARLLLRHAADRLRHRRGARLTMGNALVGRLYHSLRKRGVPVLFESPVARLVREDGRVAGAAVEAADGELRIRARRGVVAATGGFARDPGLRARHMPSPTPPYSMAADGNDGDGVAFARAAGARIGAEGHQSGGFWSPVSAVPKEDRSRGLFPHLTLDRAKPGLIAVNAAGRRFVNEAASYHDFVEAMYRSHETAGTMPAWLVCDAAFVRRYGLGAIRPGTRRLRRLADRGWIVLADGPGELARAIDVDPAGLAETVARNNRFAADGTDPDFGKGGDDFNRFNGDPAHRPNPCLGPIGAPLVAMAVWPAEIGCSVGIATTADGEALGEDGEVVAGLYACGNDMSSIMAGTYPGPGITLGPAVVFGYRIAMHAAGRAA